MFGNSEPGRSVHNAGQEWCAQSEAGKIHLAPRAFVASDQRPVSRRGVTLGSDGVEAVGLQAVFVAHFLFRPPRGFDKSAGLPICTAQPPEGRGTWMCRVTNSSGTNLDSRRLAPQARSAGGVRPMDGPNNPLQHMAMDKPCIPGTGSQLAMLVESRARSAPLLRAQFLWWPCRPLATLGRKLRQGRKAATVLIDAGAEASRQGHRLFHAAHGKPKICVANLGPRLCASDPCPFGAPPYQGGSASLVHVDAVGVRSLQGRRKRNSASRADRVTSPTDSGRHIGRRVGDVTPTYTSRIIRGATTPPHPRRSARASRSVPAP